MNLKIYKSNLKKIPYRDFNPKINIYWLFFKIVQISSLSDQHNESLIKKIIKHGI